MLRQTGASKGASHWAAAENILINIMTVAEATIANNAQVTQAHFRGHQRGSMYLCCMDTVQETEKHACFNLQ